VSGVFGGWVEGPEGPAERGKGNGDWHIVLRWSMEAIAAAAYEMTFWYMEKVGEAIYTQKSGQPDPKPGDWAEMTSAEAGRNAIKMMLYYAIRPDAILAEEAREQNKPLPRPVARRLGRAIALYNTYGFGYALGMYYRNPQGQPRCSGRRTWTKSRSTAELRTAVGSPAAWEITHERQEQ
jgi:hypothetical protein